MLFNVRNKVRVVYTCGAIIFALKIDSLIVNLSLTPTSVGVVSVFDILFTI